MFLTDAELAEMTGYQQRQYRHMTRWALEHLHYKVRLFDKNGRPLIPRAIVEAHAGLPITPTEAEPDFGAIA